MYKISIGEKCVINRNCIIWGNITIGNCVVINPSSVLYGNVKIGNKVMIAPNVMIAGGNHGILDNGIPMINQESKSKGITIGSDIWIGANSVILDGVIIEDGAVIAAGSVVTKNVTSFTIVAGNPATLLRKR
jgi:acetyltransferase-like isoleucine patch superfamily enzyme